MRLRITKPLMTAFGSLPVGAEIDLPDTADGQAWYEWAVQQARYAQPLAPDLGETIEVPAVETWTTTTADVLEAEEAALAALEREEDARDADDSDNPEAG